MEVEQEHTQNCHFYMALASFYGAFVEIFLWEYSEEALTPGDRYVRESTVDQRNCVEHGTVGGCDGGGIFEEV